MNRDARASLFKLSDISKLKRVEKSTKTWIFVRPCIIDINNIDNQLDATIMVY